MKIHVVYIGSGKRAKVHWLKEPETAWMFPSSGCGRVSARGRRVSTRKVDESEIDCWYCQKALEKFKEQRRGEEKPRR